jgi:CBS domain-containing protein
MRHEIPTSELVLDHATTPLQKVTPTCTIREAAHVMYLGDLGALGVADDGPLLGVITERDLVTALATGADPDREQVGDRMSRPPLTASAGDHVLDVSLLMLDRWIRHVPLVDDRGRDVGMVSLRDVLRPLILQAMTPPAR